MNQPIQFLAALEKLLVAWAGPMLLQSALLFVLLLALDFPLRSRVPSGVRYALWLLFLVKLALPPSLTLPTSPLAWFPPNQPPVQTPEKTPAPRVVQVRQPAPVVETAAENPPPPASQPFSLAVLWLAGMFFLAGRVAQNALRSGRRLRAAQTAPPEFERLAESCVRELGLRRPVRLRFTDAATVPMLCGLLRPTLLLPSRALGGLSLEQWRRVFLHELAHARRGDPWVHWAQTALQIAYWWHPLVWAANHRIARLREEAVDEMVVVVLRGDSLSYCESLLAAARFCGGAAGTSSASMAAFGSTTALAARVQRLTGATQAPRGPAWQPWVLAASLGLLVLPMAHGVPESPADSEPKESSLISKTYIAHDFELLTFLNRAYLSNGPGRGTNAADGFFWKQFGLATPPHITAFNGKTLTFTLLAGPLEHERFRQAVSRYSAPPRQITFETTFIEGLATDINHLQLGRLFDQHGPGASSATLDDGQAGLLLVSAKQVKGLSLWTGLSVTTEEGRQAHAGSVEGGKEASVDLLASVGDDQRKLRVIVLPQLRIPGGPAEATGPKALVILPDVAQRVIEDGQTILVETQPKSSPNSSEGGHQLVALVTFTLVDPAGNRVNPPSPSASAGPGAEGTVVFSGEIKGAIRRGAIRLPAGQPKYLSEAVLEMEPSEFANLKNVSLSRIDRVTGQPMKSIKIDVEEILRTNVREKDYILQDGDHVVISPKVFNVK